MTTCKHVNVSRLTGHCLDCGAPQVLKEPRFSKSWAERLGAVEEDLAAFKASHALGSGEAAELLSTSEQDARSWALIEQWWAKQSEHRALEVSFAGPFAAGSGKSFFYCRLPLGHDARGHTRSDALAHAAEWCKGLL